MGLTANAATPAEWRTLLEVTGRFIAEESWMWVDSHYLFGVRPPDGKTYYCGFLGGFGEGNIRGFHVFYNPRAYYWFYEHWPEDDIFYDLDGVVMLLRPKNELDGEDRRLLATFGFTPPVRGNWPLFRNLRPGFHPWYLEREDIRVLTICLEQGIELARRSQMDPELLEPTRRGRILVRVGKKRNGSISWADKREEIPTIEDPKVEPPLLDQVALRRLAKMRLKKQGIWECDYFYSPVPVQPKPKERPYYPFFLVIADSTEGKIIGHRMVSHKNVYSETVALVMATISEKKTLPERLFVRRKETYEVLSPLAEALGEPELLRQAEELMLIDYFRAFLKETADDFGPF
ncbi:MAG: DUF6930 domain-containing protein [Bacillota bacterium]